MGPVWWISCTWEQYIELHVCPVLMRDTFLFHMFMQLRDPKKPNSGVCLWRQIGIVLCVCVNAPSPSILPSLCVCVRVYEGEFFPTEHIHILLKPTSINTGYLFTTNPQGGSAALEGCLVAPRPGDLPAAWPWLPGKGWEAPGGS